MPFLNLADDPVVDGCIAVDVEHVLWDVQVTWMADLLVVDV